MKNFEDLFFAEKEFIKNEVIPLPEEEARHLIKVKRARQDKPICLINGMGQLATGCWKTGPDKLVSVEIAEVVNTTQTRDFCLYIAPALLKKSAWEVVLEKTTELGIDQIVPIISERIVADKPKIERWEKVIISAMKQSNNFWKPKLKKTISLHLLTETYPDVHWIIFHEKAEKLLNIKDIDVTQKKIGLIIGPEGGFTDEEISLFDNVFLLGHTRLRAETAAITAINQIDLLYRWIFPR